MKLYLFLALALFVTACKCPETLDCKIQYPILLGDSNYEIEARADNLSDAQTLAYRVMNRTCGMYYPSRRLSVLGETFSVDSKQSTVRIQFACVQ
jgi:hypothetical protein